MSIQDTYPVWADRARVVVIGGLSLYLTLVTCWVAISVGRLRRAMKTQPETDTEETTTQ